MEKLYKLSDNAMNLVEISKHINEKGEYIDEETGELVDKETLELLDKALTEELNRKGTGLIKAYNNIKSDIDIVTSEIERLQKIRNKMLIESENFSNYVMINMIKMGKKKIESPLGKITVGTSTAAEIYDAVNVPEKYKKKQTKVEIKISKTDLKKALQGGEVIPGARLKINHNIKFK